MPKRNTNLRRECPFEAAMDLIGGKWKGLILFRLMKGPRRFNVLRAEIPEISSKVLSSQLRELEQDRLITRTVYVDSALKVEYALTDLGKNLEPAFALMKQWGGQLI
jgi:DNA-binding HxlR family transcriptional regulator